MGLVALVFAYLMAAKIDKVDIGTQRMKEISTYIQEGSMAFMKREYRVLSIFSGSVKRTSGIFNQNIRRWRRRHTS